ncbi:hypothetical protein EJ04DRAFT_508856 [Polyplosphaeria fusca]|uniref:Uncharacterized protein n=1 Tax=Polyplosphaeria fusca TaxID=682080 RepID=A0A9P4V428_9PLEO|nr:hypothetical protein EJ04DRAFT_508856 [Polyplosphaeria fusca]
MMLRALCDKNLYLSGFPLVVAQGLDILAYPYWLIRLRWSFVSLPPSRETASGIWQATFLVSFEMRCHCVVP